MEVSWKVHTPNLLNEVLNSNPGMAIFSVPFNVLGKLLAAVGERAAEINDPQMNELMCRLTIYSVADPTSPDYDPQIVKAISREATEHRLAADGRKPRGKKSKFVIPATAKA